MAANKKQPVVLPRKKEEGEEAPTFLFPPSGDYNWKVSEGDWVTVPLDSKGIPLITGKEKKKKSRKEKGK